ncbi:MAG: TonB-dependent receptor [Cytophagales bacterium]|nr:TonB-dependent receptor [Cytophagales bacterium]
MKKELKGMASGFRSPGRWLVFCMLFLFSMQQVGAAESEFSFLKNRKLTLQELFQLIEDKSDYTVLYDSKEINLKQVVQFNDDVQSMTSILNQIFTVKSRLEYEIQNKHVVVKKKDVRPTAEVSQKQKQQVKGVVKDEQGEPLPGVSVFVKNTTNGVNTNLNGEFTLAVEPGSILVFSYVGFLTQEVEVQNQTVVNIALKPNVEELEEVVVIGYGTQKKANLTGAVAAMKSEEIVDVPYNNIQQSMAGRIAGVFTRSNGGGPGDDAPEIRVRGMKNQLVVVDGIIRDDYGNIDPNDIDSYVVLKDAAACAVYGARAANGVILITTKRGEKTDGVTINYSGSTQWARPTVWQDKLNSRDQIELRDRASYNMGGGPVYNPDIYTPEVIEKYMDGSDPDHYGVLNIRDIYKDFAVSTRHNLSVSGKKGNTNYYTSLGYNLQGSPYSTDISKFRKYNIRTNLDHMFDKIGLKIGVDLNFRKSIDDEPISGDEWLHAKAFHRIGSTSPMPPRYSDGRYGTYWNANPLVFIDPDRGYRKEEIQRFESRLYLEYQVPGVKGLSLKAVGSYDDVNKLYKQWSTPIDLYNKFEDTEPQPKNPPSLSENHKYDRSYTLEGHVNFERSFGNHNVHALAVFSQHESKYDYFLAQKRRFLTNALDELDLGVIDNMDIRGNGLEQGRMGIVGRMQYNYAEKYLLEANFRYDGSSNFRTGSKWGFFPSMSIGYRISQENYFRRLVPENVIGELKLRASYGETGNDVIRNSNGNPVYFRYMGAYKLGGVHYFGGEKNMHSYEDRLAYPDITWETQTNYNLGMDVSFYQNKFELIFDTYLYRRKDILIKAVDESNALLGLDFPRKNAGITRRGGYELSLLYHETFFNELKVDLGVNYSYFTSFWEERKESPENMKDPYLRDTQEEPSAKKWLTSTGLYQNVDDLLNNPYPDDVSTLRPGDIRYKDLNGDGQINVRDLQTVGRSYYPQNVYGITANLAYRGWSMNMLFQGAHNASTWVGQGKHNIRWRLIQHSHYSWAKGKDWRPENPDSVLPRLGDQPNNYKNSTFWILDNDYLRLKSLKIGYNFTERLLKSSRLGKLEIYVAGTNLLTWQKTWDLFDPEDNTSEHDNYPNMRTFSLGLNLSF